jgi:hypothetical protein
VQCAGFTEGRGSAVDQMTTDSGEPMVLNVYDPQHQPHLVMTLCLGPSSLDVEPSEAMRELLRHDLEQGQDEAAHIPLLGWILKRALAFAEHRMADYFGQHDLRRVKMQFDGEHLRLHLGHTVLDLGPGEIEPRAAQAFVDAFKQHAARA